MEADVKPRKDMLELERELMLFVNERLRAAGLISAEISGRAREIILREIERLRGVIDLR